ARSPEHDAGDGGNQDERGQSPAHSPVTEGKPRHRPLRAVEPRGDATVGVPRSHCSRYPSFIPKPCTGLQVVHKVSAASNAPNKPDTIVTKVTVRRVLLVIAVRQGRRRGPGCAECCR